MKSAISYITLGVNHLDKMEAFYNALGFSLHATSKDENHAYVMYKMGGVVLALYPKEQFSKHIAHVIKVEDKNTAMSISLNLSDKEHVDSFIQLARKSNANIVKEGFAPPWGGYCAYFKDIEDNLWEVVWHEKFVFPDDS